MTNIYPVFGSGFSSIAKGSMKSVFAYAGAEIILLIYPFLKEKNKMLAVFTYKCSYGYSFICMVCFYNHLLFRSRYCY